MNKIFVGLITLAIVVMSTIAVAQPATAWRLAIRNVGGTTVGNIGQIADVKFYGAGDISTLPTLNDLYHIALIATTQAPNQISVTGDYTAGINAGDTEKTGAFTQNTTIAVIGTTVNNGDKKVSADATYSAPNTVILVTPSIVAVPSAGYQAETYAVATTETLSGLTDTADYTQQITFDAANSVTIDYTSTTGDTFLDVVGAVNALISTYGVASIDDVTNEIVVTSNTLGVSSAVAITAGSGTNLFASMTGYASQSTAVAGQADVGESSGGVAFATRDSASTNQAGTGIFATGRGVNAVFDNNAGSYFETTFSINDNNQWFVQYTVWPENGTAGAIDVKQYTVTVVDGDKAPNIWDLQRLEGREWVTVETRGSQGWRAGETRTFVVGN